MNTEEKKQQAVPWGWLRAAGLWIILCLMYSPTFLTDYLMKDEWLHVGRRSGTFAAEAAAYFYSYGRGLFGLYQKVVYDFAGYSPVRIQFIRFVNLALLGAAAAVLLLFLESRTKSKFLPFIAVLTFLAQPCFQVLMGYSLQLISNSVPAIWLSLAAFYLYFFVFERRRLPGLLEVGVVVILLLLAMQSTQTYAFFAVIPMAYLALNDWENHRVRILKFLMIGAAVWVLSGVLYKVGLDVLHSQGSAGYVEGEQGMAALSSQPGTVILNALNPLSYWSAFKMWTFPFPFENVRPLGESTQEIMAVVIMILWTGLILASILIEIRQTAGEKRRDIIWKWLAVLFFFGFAAVPILADSPTAIIDHRPHLLLTFSGLVVFTSAYALQVLAARSALLRGTGIKVAVGFVAFMLAAGAQSGVLRGIVDNERRQLDFMRSALRATDPSSFDTVLVVLPNQVPRCMTEPCGPWMGEPIEDSWRLERSSFYHYALATSGADPRKKNVIYTSQRPPELQDRTVVIDWNVFLAGQRRGGAGPLGSSYPAYSSPDGTALPPTLRP